MKFPLGRGIRLPASKAPREPVRIVIVRGPDEPVRTLTLPRGLISVCGGLLGAWLLLTGALAVKRSVASAPPEAVAQLEAAAAPPQEGAAGPDEELSTVSRPLDDPLRRPVSPPRFLVESANTGELVDVSLAGLGGEPDTQSYEALRRLMRCPRTESESPIDPRLIEVLHQIAERTQSKVQIISAFRAPTNRSDRNYHTRGMAADIRAPGLTVEALRDLAKSLGVRGVGYYPVSKFIHVDVRDRPYVWTDRSGPSTIARRESAPHRQEDEIELAIEPD